MASGRISYDKTTKIGQKLDRVLGQGASFRAAAHELALEVGRYNDANADLATDSGIASDSVQAFKDLLARTDGEMGGDFVEAIAQDAQGMTRTFLDSMA